MSFSSLGFVGLGVMGAGMCANLVRKAGVPVHGADLNAQAVVTLEAIGLVPQADPVAVAREAECLFLSLPGGAQVEAVCDQLLAAPGKLKMVVDMSTAPAELARTLAARFASKGIAFVDAPVARLRQAAIDGTLSIMVGASEADFATIRPWLLHMGIDVTHCGVPGSGQVTKILNNMVVFMEVHALAEALAIGRANGVDGQTLFDVLSLGSADSFMLRNTGMKNLVPDNFPLATFPTDYAIKDISYALDLAKAVDIEPTGALATRALLEKSRVQGQALEYYPVFVRTIEGRGGKSD